MLPAEWSNFSLMFCMKYSHFNKHLGSQGNGFALYLWLECKRSKIHDGERWFKTFWKDPRVNSLLRVPGKSFTILIRWTNTVTRAASVISPFETFHLSYCVALRFIFFSLFFIFLAKLLKTNTRWCFLMRKPQAPSLKHSPAAALEQNKMSVATMTGFEEPCHQIPNTCFISKDRKLITESLKCELQDKIKFPNASFFVVWKSSVTKLIHFVHIKHIKIVIVVIHDRRKIFYFYIYRYLMFLFN